MLLQPVDAVHLLNHVDGVDFDQLLTVHRQPEIGALIKVLPRMTAPMLTEQEVAALELPDLVALAGKVVGFLSPNSVQ